MAYAPPPSETIPQVASASINRTNKEEIGCRVIRNEKDWKWGKQVSITNSTREFYNRIISFLLITVIVKYATHKIDIHTKKNQTWSRNL